MARLLHTTHAVWSLLAHFACMYLPASQTSPFRVSVLAAGHLVQQHVLQSFHEGGAPSATGCVV